MNEDEIPLTHDQVIARIQWWYDQQTELIEYFKDDMRKEIDPVEKEYAERIIHTLENMRESYWKKFETILV